jgi:hypothetical protein
MRDNIDSNEILIYIIVSTAAFLLAVSFISNIIPEIERKRIFVMLLFVIYFVVPIVLQILKKRFYEFIMLGLEIHFIFCIVSIISLIVISVLV